MSSNAILQPDSNPLTTLRESLRSLRLRVSNHQFDREMNQLLALVDTVEIRSNRCADCGRSLTLREVPAPLNHPRLSRRESEVMTMILNGRRLKEIAAILDISVKTVTTHRTRLMRKLSLEDNLGLYRYGIVNGLIPL